MTNKELIHTLLNLKKSPLVEFMEWETTSPTHWVEVEVRKLNCSEKLKARLSDFLPEKILTLGNPDVKLAHGLWVKRIIDHITTGVENGSITEADVSQIKKATFQRLFDVFTANLKNSIESKTLENLSEEDLHSKLVDLTNRNFLTVQLEDFYNHPKLKETMANTIGPDAAKSISATLATVKYQPLIDLIDATISTLRSHKPTDKSAIILVNLGRTLHQHMSNLSGGKISAEDCHISLVSHLRGIKNLTKSRTRLSAALHTHAFANCGKLSDLIKKVLTVQYPQYKSVKDTMPSDLELTNIQLIYARMNKPQEAKKIVHSAGTGA